MRRVVLSLCLVFMLPALAVAAVGDAASQAQLIANHVGFGTPTGGQGGTLCTVSNLNDTGAGSLRSCVYDQSNRWVVFSVSGTINISSDTMNFGSNVTIDGRGANITITGRQFWINTVSNIIIHNLTFGAMSQDGISILGGASTIWMDHLTFSGNAGDENIDIGCGTNAAGIPGVTISWSHFFNSTGSGSILVGSNGSVTCKPNTKITLHHNYYDDSHVRLPLARAATIHSFNNYYKNTVTNSQCSAQGSCIGAQIRSQAQFNSENDIFSCPSSVCGYPRVKAINDYTGDTPPDTNPDNVKVSGQWSVTGQETYEQLNQGTIFTPSSFYSYTLATADATLRDAITHTTMGAGKVDNPYNYLATGTEALVGWWKLDETSGTSASDSSGNSFTGTLTNMESPGDWVTGIIGSVAGKGALSFDNAGNEYVTIPDNDLLSPVTTGQFSICTWAYLPSAPTGFPVIVGKGTSGQYEYALEFDSTQHVLFALWPASGTPLHALSTTTGTVALNTWTHICGTYESAVLVATYINAAPDGSSSSFTGVLTNGTSPMDLGRRPDNAGYLNGRLDDVRIFNYALTQPEVAAIMAEGFDVVYHLDDVASPANDSGQPGLYDGTWQNTPTPVAGKLNGALSFASASSEYVSVATSPSLSGPSTVALWVKVTDLVAATGTILSNSDATPSNTQVGLNIDSNGSWNYLYTLGGTTRGFPSAAGAITIGPWIHLAVTDDGAGTVTLYQAGSPISNTPFGTPTAKPSTAPGLLAIGRRGSNPAQYLNGAVDEVHLVSRVMSAGEIAALAAEGSDSTAPAAPTNLRVVSP